MQRLHQNAAAPHRTETNTLSEIRAVGELPLLARAAVAYAAFAGLRLSELHGLTWLDYGEEEHLGNRTVRTAMEKRLHWSGWHGLRRGIASNLFQLGCDDLTVHRVLRHAKVQVTREHYIKVRDARLEDAMQKPIGCVWSR